MATSDDRNSDRSHNRRQKILRRNTYELYQFLAQLGEELYLEAMSLSDGDEGEYEAAALASVDLVLSLQKRGLLVRIAAVP